MAAHGDACSGSASLCALLFDKLSAEIPNLRREPKQKSCAIFQLHRNRFAYVYHYKNKSAVEIWCRGDVAKLRILAGSTFRQRGVQGGAAGTWAEFTGSFKVSSPDEISAAVRCLVEAAYPET